jgi:hypothetical protein
MAVQLGSVNAHEDHRLTRRDPLPFNGGPASAADVGAHYPTSDEAFHVLACMETNGRDADGLYKCSCAINAIEAQLPYQQILEAILMFAMRQAGGEKKTTIYRDTAPMVADRLIRSPQGYAVASDVHESQAADANRRTHELQSEPANWRMQAETMRAGVTVHCIRSIGIILKNERGLKRVFGFAGG